MNKNTKPFYKSEIPADWETPSFNEVYSLLKTFSFSRSQLSSSRTIDEIQNIHYGDIHATFDSEIFDFENESRVPYLLDGLIPKESFDTDEFPALKNGDLIIADASEDYEGICDCIEVKNLNGRNVISGLHTFAARANEKSIAFGFRTYSLKHSQVIRELRRIATGISVYGVSKRNISKIQLALPPLPEQDTIAHILSLMDKAINKNMQLTTKKELRKKWLMHNLLSGKNRIKSVIKNKQRHKTKLGDLPIDWFLMSLNNILNPIGKLLSPEKDKLYQQIGIRSHTKGIFHKGKVTGTALGNKRVFWIEPDCFVVNIVFAWEHAIAKTTENENGLIASHRFPMYKPKDGVLDLDYLLYYFKSPRGKHLLGQASPGGAGRNKTLGKSGFMKLQIPVPSIEEQKAIAQILTTTDKEIQLLKSKTEKLREQKKGMMQQLLTGKIRIKTKIN